MLSTRTWGTGDPVVLIHGFTQSGRTWEPVAERLSDVHQVIAVDAPGHGGSAAVDADLVAGAALIGAAGGRAAYVGYSMGGRFALHLALARPDLVTRLVLVSATAGIDDPHQRADRRRADGLIADRLERDGVEVFLRWWLSRPLFATLPAEATALDSRLGNTATGLASSLRRAGTGTQAPLWDRLGELSMPVLVVAGELDDAYLACAHRLVEGIGANATLVAVPGAGHTVHLEAPEVFAAALEAFLV
ncbi:MAG: alpha/beta fold hydrolase [Actinomycetota bacterium]|nr:alpha/beta fold hydrolase [Actinomycetota bacterium]